MIANKNTHIDAQTTVLEVQLMLVRAKAQQISIEYEEETPIAISFEIAVEGHPVSFRLPCNWRGVLAALKNEKSNRLPTRLLTGHHANRVGWRIVRDWLRAQLSIIEANAATLQEVMLPWAVTSSGNTVGQEMLSGRTSRLIGLPGPSENPNQ